MNVWLSCHCHCSLIVPGQERDCGGGLERDNWDEEAWTKGENSLNAIVNNYPDQT